VKIILAIQLFRNMGLRYSMYRVVHEIEKRLGILKKRHPSAQKGKTFIALQEWKDTTPKFVTDRKALRLPKNPSEQLEESAKKILRGEISFFSHQWIDLGPDYDWITNPDSGYKYNINKHWSEISDLNPANGDIKYVWEKSRFTYLLTIIRYDYHFDSDHSEFVFNEIEGWINANPVNQGPNWRCSQEISLRILNWCFALYFYKDSPFLTEERWSNIQNAIYWQLHHVYNHINFSRIAVRNNHAITETLMLTLSELLFPFIPETKKWAANGRKWFEQEIEYQIYKDGTFLQFSMNYHRVVIQLLSIGFALTEKHDKPFSDIVYTRAYSSLNFLYKCLQHENGHLPNSGSNDGALFFPLTSADYRDYRPQLNTLHVILTGLPLFEDSRSAEDAGWICNDAASKAKNFKPLVIENGISSFDEGGYYLMREQGSFTFIRCGSFKDRPNQADNLHLDIWVNGENIIRDQGSYKYNTDEKTLMYFKGTEGHNTVSVSGEDQMLKGGRFIWYYWVKKAKGRLVDNQDSYIFNGEINAFRQVSPNILHHREVVKEKEKNIWTINDEVKNKSDKELTLFWHINPEMLDRLKIECTDFNGNILEPIFEEKWYSGYYGKKTPSKRISFKTHSTGFKTIISLQK
jgi:hypothetical protein